MKTNPRKKGNLAAQVAHLGLPPLRVDDGLVELSSQQEHRAKERWVIESYSAARVPKVGDDVKTPVPGSFVVTEVKHLLVPRARETIRAVLLLVRKLHKV
jgi:hypothetical protein